MLLFETSNENPACKFKYAATDERKTFALQNDLKLLQPAYDNSNKWNDIARLIGSITHDRIIQISFCKYICALAHCIFVYFFLHMHIYDILSSLFFGLIEILDDEVCI